MSPQRTVYTCDKTAGHGKGTDCKHDITDLAKAFRANLTFIIDGATRNFSAVTHSEKCLVYWLIRTVKSDDFMAAIVDAIARPGSIEGDSFTVVIDGVPTTEAGLKKLLEKNNVESAAAMGSGPVALDPPLAEKKAEKAKV